jgi:hypothetical protein
VQPADHGIVGQVLYDLDDANGKGNICDPRREDDSREIAPIQKHRHPEQWTASSTNGCRKHRPRNPGIDRVALGVGDLVDTRAEHRLKDGNAAVLDIVSGPKRSQATSTFIQLDAVDLGAAMSGLEILSTEAIQRLRGELEALNDRMACQRDDLE